MPVQVPPGKWKIGITEAETPNGNIVKLHNKERCIIDLIKRKDKIEKQLYLHALREYFADDTTDKTALLKYAKILLLKKKSEITWISSAKQKHKK